MSVRQSTAVGGHRGRLRVLKAAAALLACGILFAVPTSPAPTVWNEKRNDQAVDETPQANVPPVVDAGIDQRITLLDSAFLDGMAADDGLPDPPGTVTVTWTVVRGPGAVRFGNASAAQTTASFSASGTYVLRLTASDGELSASDNVTIVVDPAPTSPTPAPAATPGAPPVPTPTPGPSAAATPTPGPGPSPPPRPTPPPTATPSPRLSPTPVPTPPANSGARPIVLSPGEGAILGVPGPPTLFSWSGVLGVQRYLFEYTGPGTRFTNPLGTGPDPVYGVSPWGGAFVVGGTSATIAIPVAAAPGAYQLRIAALDASGRLVGTFSEARTVFLQPLAADSPSQPSGANPAADSEVCPVALPPPGSSLNVNRTRARPGDPIALSVAGIAGESVATVVSRTNAGASFRRWSLLVGTDLAILFTCRLPDDGQCSRTFIVPASAAGTFFFQAVRSSDPTFQSGSFSATNGACLTVE